MEHCKPLRLYIVKLSFNNRMKYHTANGAQLMILAVGNVKARRRIRRTHVTVSSKIQRTSITP
jgi:hypothetical protein